MCTGVCLKSVAFLLFMLSIVVPVSAAMDKQYKVLVVMSYHESYVWEEEIRAGIDDVLAGVADIRYAYLDAKNDFAGGAEKARNVFALYQEMQPAGVIAVDDAAQSLFVLPYLKDKVKTPVMFCGVNKEPAEYGYPASNVSGILERLHMKESLAFLKQLVPSVKAFCAVMKDDDTSAGNLQQFRQEAETYPVRLVRVAMPKTVPEALAVTKKLNLECDALFLTPLDGLPDDNGVPLSSREIVPALVKSFAGPVISGISNDLKSGVLCSVLKTGQEQGTTAARMLLEAMRGEPVTSIPISVNRNGKRVINVSALKKMGIKPRPVDLRGAELVTSEQ